MEISASHSYVLDKLSPEERIATFGKSAATHCHGHNYEIRVTIAGPIDPGGNWVINIKDLDQIMREVIDEQLDHRHYNVEVPKLRDHWPTLETLAPFIWEEMEPHLGSCRLHEVQVFESPDFFVEYQGDRTMVHLTRIYRFSAAHRLHNPTLSDVENRELFGKCNNLHGHGHDYTLEVTLAGEPDPRTDAIINVDVMDSILKERILDLFDHVYLNLDTEAFRDLNPSAENMVIVFWDLLSGAFPPAKLHRLRLWETSKSYFDYYGPKVAA
jgi:6-pyruvoyltetrahydropterin/6-carboxytetrahydropterin synthase